MAPAAFLSARPRITIALLSIVGLLVVSHPASAQNCSSIVPPCPPNEAPRVVISPAGGSFTSASLTVTVTLTDDNAVTSVGTSPTVSLSGTWGPGNASATLSGTLTLTSGANTFIVDAADGDAAHGADTVTYYYTPPPPQQPRDSATLSLAGYSSTIRALAGCSGCLYGAAVYSTPAYISRDMPRSITLLYSSAQAVPRGFVKVDANINTSTTPTGISLQLLQGSTAVSLTNGGTEAWYSGATGTVRLAAQIDASGLATGVHRYTALVRTWWNSTSYESRIPVRVLIVNAQSNPEGAGWTIAGLQRLVTAGGDSVAIADGSGGITFFARSGSTTFFATAGDFTTLTVNSSSGIYTRTSADGSFARFSSAGLLTAVGTRFGDSTVYSYDGSNRLTGITDEAGKSTTLTYAPSGSCPSGSTSGTLCAITTPGGRVSKFVVNSSNDLVQIIDPDAVTSFTGTYSGHKLTAATDRLASSTSLAYDSFTGLSSVTAQSVTTTTTTGSTSIESPITTFQSIEAALLATSNNSSGSARGAVRVDTAYAKLIAPNGSVTRMVLQGAGEPITAELLPVTGPAQKLSTLYTADYLPAAVTAAPVGGTTTYGWSGSQLTSTVNANGTLTTMSYETTNGLPTATRVNGVRQDTSFYSGSPLKLDWTKVGAMTTSYTWDSRGRLTQSTDGLTTKSISYASGGFQNASQVTVGGNVTQIVHDQFGRDSTITDAFSQVTTLLYDLLNRPTSTTQPGSAVTSASVSENTTAHTATTTVTDPRSLVFAAVANALGWPTSTTDPQSYSSTAGFDRNGFLRRAVNRAGNAVSASYDSLGRIVSLNAKLYPTTFNYDASTSAADPHWSVGFTNDSRDSVTTDGQGRATSVVTTRAGGTFTSTMTYDAAGNRRQLKVTNGSWTDSLRFVTDSMRYPFQLPDFGGTWTRVSYTPTGRLVDTLRYPTGSSPLKMLPSNYTVLRRPVDVGVYVGTSLQEQWTYGYDALGRITTIDNGTVHDFMRRALTYDARGRLTSYTDQHIYADSTYEGCPPPEITCDPPPPGWTFSWNYVTVRSATYAPDHSGNRTDGSASLSNDRLSSMTGADAVSYSFSYDVEGRRTAKTASGYSQTYGWNGFGQLVWIKTNGDSIAYRYDAAGRRVRKMTSAGTTEYLWDGDNLLMELDGSGNRVRQYSYQAGIDRPVAVRISGTMYYYQLDEAGNVSAVWNTSNAKVATYTDDPYGYPIATGGSVTQPLRWKGREYDSETGLYYVRARYYDPTVGRFISEDPIGLAGGINPYVFADGEPVNRSDPSGLECVSWTLTWSEVSPDHFVGTFTCDLNVLDGMRSTARAPRNDNFGNPCARGGTCQTSALGLASSLIAGGTGYQYGGGKDKIDCSEYCTRLLQAQGCGVPRLTTATMAGNPHFTPVNSDQAGPGDLIVIPGHMGLIVGKGRDGTWMVSDWGPRMNRGGSVFTYWGPGPRFAGHSVHGPLSSFSYFRPKCG